MEMALLAVAVALALVAAALAWKLHAAGQKAALADARRAAAQAQAEAAISRLDGAVEARVESERALAAAQQRMGDLERVLKDADAARQDLVAATRSAVLETATALSSKLIEDHKRETAEARKEAEEHTSQVTETLVKRMEDITGVMTKLNADIEAKGRVLDKVWRSLTSPGGSGQIAEIGLANTLKEFGLESGRDFELQVTTADEVTGRRLRPDALVFLPGNKVVVIDCKASKYLIEIAEAESARDEEAAYANLARTMNGHLKALDDKDYRGAVIAGWRTAGRSGELGQVFSVMYLPNEAVLEKLSRADPTFFARARAAEIILAGPAGLQCILTAAAAEISRARQAENQQHIVEGARTLLESVRVALGDAIKVGKGVKAAADAYDDFTRSVNGRLLPRARKLVGLGVKLDKGLPPNLPAYTVMSQEGDQLIEGEAEEVDEPPAAPARRLLAE
jgi:DNA recombination protein RmuC